MDPLHPQDKEVKKDTFRAVGGTSGLGVALFAAGQHARHRECLYRWYKHTSKIQASKACILVKVVPTHDFSNNSKK
jgi:hypothetical protein